MNVLRTIFISFCVILIPWNIYQLTRALTPDRPVGFAGIKFSGLENILKQETHISYITDLDLDQPASLAEYEQAQYVLAPAILDANNPGHRFLIINCSSDSVALSKLKEIGARSLTRNNLGVILAVHNDITSGNLLSTKTRSP